jgi:hypothetical protein
MARLASAVLSLAAACARESGAPTCEQAMDHVLALSDHQVPSLRATMSVTEWQSARDSGIAACRVRQLDAIERACVSTAPDLVTAAECQIAGDRRRHPDWNWR